ncbi:amino acid ABC transporter substrate-binding protein [Skermanella mucosa]|uniref:amino acid ABC transporter substrate-binding protein n=1 Tax=Skermanella mucosa TaxID=1789672 RepID=UPI00192C28C7|nr:amino acid ABC transporter substrate-binding protein [Skermanella mucosa]UEM19222.1 amino acid ABC transporter substrate-binding protein [Skermanella mucosa]
MKTKIIAAMGTALAIALGSGAASAGPTLNAVKQKGFVQCGVNTGLPGFSNPDSQGNWTGLDVDFCRAVAAAIFGDAKAVRFTPLSAQQRFTALQSGEIDILSRNTTWTLTRDTSLGLNFAPTTFYDGQGFMVPKALGVSSAAELSGATVCVQPGTTTELNLADYFRAKGMQFQPVVIESFDEVNAAFFSGRCDVYTTDASGMASIRSTLAPNPDDYIILPELISKEPLGPAVRHGDDEFYDIVKWTVYATIEAEEKGVNSGNVDEMLKSQDPTIQRLLGSNPGVGQALGLDEKWAYNVIKTVGNYGEIFERNVGVKTALKLERGPNALWTNGGLMYAMPVR